MIHSEIKASLESLGVPVDFHTYTGDADTYITFFQFDERTAFAADDEEFAAELSYQVNIFSKGNYMSLIQGVKEQMKTLGGVRTSEVDIYNEGGIYQRSMRFTFTR